MQSLIDALLEEEQCKTVNIHKASGTGITHVISCVGQDDIVYKKVLYNAVEGKAVRVHEGVRHVVKRNRETTIVGIENVAKIETEELERIVNGGLRQCIQAHGDITVLLIGSASKRIVRGINGKLKELLMLS